MITFNIIQDFILYSIAIFVIGLIIGIWLTVKIVKNSVNRHEIDLKH